MPLTDPEHLPPDANRDRLTYCVDIDGVLCTNTWGAYERAEPLAEAIAAVTTLHRAGHRIVLFTARGTTTGIDWRDLTERQMREWGVAYDELHLGKPNADVYIDDRAVHVDDWLAQVRRTAP
jgi:CMP-N,N'-diacetyllegionaminic acid synthase